MCDENTFFHEMTAEQRDEYKEVKKIEKHKRRSPKQNTKK